MTTPIQSIYDFLDTAGMFSPWEDADGDEQEAVEVQMRYLEESKVDSNKMLLLIRQSGGTADRFVSEPSFTFAIMGKVDQAPAYAESYANLLYSVLLWLDVAANDGVSADYDDKYSGDIFRSLFDFAMMMNIEGPADYAEKMLSKLYDAITTLGISGTCIISSDPISAVNGAYKTESGRYAYDMDFILKVDNGWVM